MRTSVTYASIVSWPAAAAIQPYRPQAEAPLAAPAEHADDLVQRQQAVGAVGLAAQPVRQPGHDLAPPGPQEVILGIGPEESGPTWHHGSLTGFGAPWAGTMPPRTISMTSRAKRSLSGAWPCSSRWYSAP